MSCSPPAIRGDGDRRRGPVAKGDKLTTLGDLRRREAPAPVPGRQRGGAVQPPAGIAPAASRRRHDHQAVRRLGARRPSRRRPTADPCRSLRYQPIGDVDIAPDLSVTFNQPMVPLTTLSQLDQADVPVKVTPALNGRWRWIGTRTLRFEFTGADDRLPMATSYTVEVPAGTDVAEWAQAGDGGVVDVPYATAEGADVRARRTRRSTRRRSSSRPSISASIPTRSSRPSRSRRRGPRSRFAGRPPPRSSPTIRCTRSRRTRPTAAGSSSGPCRRLPNGAALTISIGPGTPSAEGPRTTTTASIHTATTYSALAVTGIQCGYGDGCRPGIRLHHHVQQRASTRSRSTRAT